jgi:superfamily II DNA or RNA helicase
VSTTTDSLSETDQIGEPATTVPSAGQVVRVRTRTYLVERVDGVGNQALVSLACLDDDAQGEQLQVIWGLEIGPEILDRSAWKTIGSRGFDDPRQFGAYVHTLRWNCVTATNPKLFQAPFRAGIRLDAYQLEPLRKALELPRVNLFIADDVGLGKTIEAGLIASELLLRRRVREVVVACPPTMLTQWKDELESRFGLTFEILDRAYIERVRQERGYGVNAWETFPRFLISNRLLIDETYAAPLRAWLDNIRPGTLFIFDEAHHAAPSSGGRYAIDSRITKAVRDLAPRFENRLFLSATPHNGHSNSFSALLELLDPQRFTRGVKVRPKDLEPVMVRRLKEDVRAVGETFPERKVVQVDITGLPSNAPELELSRLLDNYRELRHARLASASKRKQAEGALVISGLQQRLLSSIEAFARTLKVHRRTMERVWAGEVTAPPPQKVPELFALVTDAPDSDDERSVLSEQDYERREDEAFEKVTLAGVVEGEKLGAEAERALLTRMEQLANETRGLPDARVRHLVTWIQERMCTGALLPGDGAPQRGATWNDLRLLIFTEYDDTRRYLVEMLRAAIAGTDRAAERIEVFHGPTPQEKRDAIKLAFNLPPNEHPLRILVATDAAREGINLQAHCHNLYHFDLPWNPSRLEQRNGRIDRKMQPAPAVFCHYFVYEQRPEDRVLQALVKKTEIIRRELGSLSKVLEGRLTDSLRSGIRHRDATTLAKQIIDAEEDQAKRQTVDEELEATRERQHKLSRSIDELRRRINDARRWIKLDDAALQDAISCSLELLGAKPLQPQANGNDGLDRFVFPDLADRQGADPTWAATLDTLRKLPQNGEKDFEWRRTSPLRPVVLEAPKEINDDVVQLHLQHRLVQRLLGRFTAQGFVHHDLSRACLVQSRDAIPRVILLGRVSLYGRGAVRLHEEVIAVAARWSDPATRNTPLRPYGREAEGKTVDLFEEALGVTKKRSVGDLIREQLGGSVSRDIDELLPHLEAEGATIRSDATEKLRERGLKESTAMRELLREQRGRVMTELEKSGPDTSSQLMLPLPLSVEEQKQYDANRRYWERWLANVDGDIEREPAKIRDFYEVGSSHIEPVGIAYLWPVTG